MEETLKVDLGSDHGQNRSLAWAHWMAGTGIQTQFTARCVPLRALLDQLAVKHVDYFSLDVEGGTMEALKGIFSHGITVDVMSVEISSETVDDVEGLLLSQGYTADIRKCLELLFVVVILECKPPNL